MNYKIPSILKVGFCLRKGAIFIFATYKKPYFSMIIDQLWELVTLADIPV
jgi:hypothetical protein